MAKENVSARVPPKIADGIDSYAEQWDLSRTEAMTAILKSGLEDPPDPRQVAEGEVPNPADRVYTVELEPENHEYVQERMGEIDDTPQAMINRVVSLYRR